MDKSNLIPFVRNNLDILFIGLNPAKGSSENKHYFSVKQSFWNQLYNAGLINTRLNKMIADNYVFGSNTYNYRDWDFGITDLITEIAESDSKRIKPTEAENLRIVELIINIKPKAVVMLHGKVTKSVCNYLSIEVPKANSGRMGKLINILDTMFFNIAFPHGNAISDIDKIERYIEVKDYLKKLSKDRYE